MAYAQLQEVLDRMAHPDTNDDALTARIEAALEAATVAIDNDTSRSFASITATRTFGAYGYCVRELWVPDLVSVTTLAVDDDDDGVYETTIDATGFELDTYSTDPAWPYDKIRLIGRDLPYGGQRRRAVSVTGVWGWSAVPAPIREACVLLAARVAQRPAEALFGAQSFGDFGAAMIRSNDPDYMNLIGPYVRMAVY